MLAGGMRRDVTEQLCILFSGSRRREEEQGQGGLCPHIHFISDGYSLYPLFPLDMTTATGWSCQPHHPYVG